MKTQEHVFKIFPEFSELTLADRDAYNSLIAKFPPISEISFATLMTWWSSLGPCKVSQLNENLVIEYWFPGDDVNSGLSLIGTNKIDESVCTIFDHLRIENRECKLVHVPDFVFNKLQYPTLFQCDSETDYTEIIIPASTHIMNDTLPDFIKTRIKRFLRATERKQVVLKNLDLKDAMDRALIIESYYSWKKKRHEIVVNDLPAHAEEAFLNTINRGADLDQKALCMFVNDQIQSFTIYEDPSDTDYRILKYSGFSCDIPGLYEYACNMMSTQFDEQGIKFVNMAIHIGDPRYTSHRLALRPINNFGKYTVRPANVQNEVTTAKKTIKKII